MQFGNNEKIKKNVKIAKIAFLRDYCWLRQGFFNNILGNRKYL